MSDVKTAVPVAVEYPDSDGEPMAENDVQYRYLTYARDGLWSYYREREPEDVYVSGNLLIYYQEGNPRVSVAPDVFVVKGVPSHERNTYLVWEEGKAPDFVLEITSDSTWRRDRGFKRDLYRRLGVTEYWQYDPSGEYLEPVLQGLALVDGEYEPIAPWETAAGPVLRSEVLGLELRVTKDGFRFRDPETEQYLPSRPELEARAAADAKARIEAEAERDAAQEERDAEAKARAEAERTQDALAARVAELEALLNRKRG